MVGKNIMQNCMNKFEVKYVTGKSAIVTFMGFLSGPFIGCR